MSTILLNDSTMIDIADAIREKTDTTNQMLPSEMGGAIRGIETGIKIPESIVAGGTPVFCGILERNSFDDTYREVAATTIKKAGTYRFGVYATGTGGYGNLNKNGTGIGDFENNGWSTFDVNCQAGDRITVTTRDSTRASINVGCFIASIKWDGYSDFTSFFITSSTAQRFISSTSMTNSGIYVDIPKTGTYKMLFYVGGGGGDGVAQLYKNNVAISNARFSITTAKPCTCNISCNAGDRITIYGETGDRDSDLILYQLSAEEIIN